MKGFWSSQAANNVIVSSIREYAVPYGASGENMSLEKFRRQHSSSSIQCVNASDNQGGPVVGVRIDDADGALLHRLEQFRVCSGQSRVPYRTRIL